MIKSTYIAVVGLFFITIWNGHAQEEESLKQQSLDDVEALSSKDFPYIERFHQAVREKLAGNFVEARALFEECLNERKNDDAVHFGLGEIAKEQNRNREARTHFENAYKLDKNNIVYLQELAYLTYELGDFETSRNYYDQLVKRQPRNVDWIYGYSQVLIYNKEYESAVNMLGKLMDQVGVVPEVMTMRADLYQELGEIEKAEQTLLTLLKEFPQSKEALQTLMDFYRRNEMEDKAIAKVRELALEQPDNMILQMKLAAIYAKEGEQEKLMETLQPIIQSDQVEMADKIHQIEQLLTFFEVEKKKLLELTTALVESDNVDPRAALLHAEVLTQNNQSREALPFYRTAIKNSPDQFEIWTTVLAFESAYNDYQALYEDAQEAMTYFPNMPFVYYAAAEGAIYTGRPEEALDLLAAGELYLLDNKQQKARYAMRKGEAYFELKEFKKGIEQFEKALAIEPEPKIRITYAFVLAKEGIALKVAAEQLEKISSAEQKTSYFLAKAQLMLAREEYTQAEEVLRSGIEKNVYKAELYDRLGDVMFLQDKIDQAQNYWKQAKELGSRNQRLDQKLKEKKIYAPKYY